ncbi:MAG: hypothetical protein A2987_02850 [Omnitrophica bacterium RIFCSPLOWO2_01_FULL_45_10]|nr:MAG: hypothetical protein A2987_02850 [Omnitrophica bacterium RIFCSPLOWO2_01_FULL_45_10]
MTRFREMLSNKNFLFLWLGQVISNFGDKLTQMALIALVYLRNPGSEMALAKLISFTVIPVFLIGPIAGVWVDRLNKRNVMIISDILRGLLVLLIPLFIFLEQILAVYLVIFLSFSLTRFFVPSKMAIIPDIVTKDKLLMANMLQDTTHMIGNVVGLVAAGIIVNMRYVGPIGGFYIDGLTFFISAVFIGMMAPERFMRGVREDLRTTKMALGSSIKRSIVLEMREGLKYLVKHKDMRFIMSVFFLLQAGIGTISCVIIVLIQNAFGTATRDLGFLGMFLVAGLFFGSILYGRFGQRFHRKRVIFTSFVASGIAIILFSQFLERRPNIIINGLLSGLIGASISPIMATINTLTHETIPNGVRGRIFSSLEAVIHLSFLAFMFLSAYLAAYINRLWILIMAGAVFSIFGIAGLLTSNNRREVS